MRLSQVYVIYQYIYYPQNIYKWSMQLVFFLKILDFPPPN
jgi:hypothetical protein